MTMRASSMSGAKAFHPIEDCTARLQTFHQCTFEHIFADHAALFDGLSLKTLREASEHRRPLLVFGSRRPQDRFALFHRCGAEFLQTCWLTIRCKDCLLQLTV